MKKSPALYIAILITWVLLLAGTVVPLGAEIVRSEHAGIGITLLVILSTAFVAYFWLNGTKDIIYTLYYYVRQSRLRRAPPLHHWRHMYGRSALPRVVMVYCTCNDFNADSLEGCLDQLYPNFEVVILDDSTKDQYRQEVDDFAARCGLQVVRRPNNAGYKAGNLNNFLAQAEYDYFVILDSDEIIPPYFIARALDYFAFYKNVGIVQGNHVATRNRNRFMNLFAIGVNSHWPTYQAVKHHHGFLSLLGHGAMVSRECYVAAGGFPHLVAEDLCFSIEARGKGYYAAFAADIRCEEEYPVNYLAFKKRHSKWTQGNMEFIKKYHHRILRSPMSWFEKLDIVLFTYNLPLTVFFSLYIVINVVVLPVLRYSSHYPTWLLVPTLLFLLAPMLNDVIFYAGKLNPLRLLWYMVHTLMLYGSMLFVSLKSSATAIFGRSVFLVTPKDNFRISFWESLRANRYEVFFSIFLCGLAYVCDGSLLPTLLIVIPGFCSVYLTLLSNTGRPPLAEEPVTVGSVPRPDLGVLRPELDTVRRRPQTGSV